MCGSVIHSPNTTYTAPVGIAASWTPLPRERLYSVTSLSHASDLSLLLAVVEAASASAPAHLTQKLWELSLPITRVTLKCSALTQESL